MNVTEKLVILNSLRKLVGEKPLKSWKKSTALLDERIAKLREQTNMTEVADPSNGCVSDQPVLTDWNLDKIDMCRDEDLEQFGNVAQFPSRIEPVKNPPLPDVKLKVPAPKLTDDEHRARAAKIIIPMIRDGMSNEEIFNKLMKEQPEVLCTEVQGEMHPTKKWYIGWFRGDVKWQDSLKKRKEQATA